MYIYWEVVIHYKQLILEKPQFLVKYECNTMMASTVLRWTKFYGIGPRVQGSDSWATILVVEIFWVSVELQTDGGQMGRAVNHKQTKQKI